MKFNNSFPNIPLTSKKSTTVIWICIIFKAYTTINSKILLWIFIKDHQYLFLHLHTFIYFLYTAENSGTVTFWKSSFLLTRKSAEPMLHSKGARIPNQYSFMNFSPGNSELKQTTKRMTTVAKLKHTLASNYQRSFIFREIFS